MTQYANTTMSPSAADKPDLGRWLTIGNLAVFHWAMYWLMNGLDKFLNRTELGLFTWHGKDRNPQFGGYFENTALPEHLIQPVLVFTGIVELLVFIPLAMVLAGVVSSGTVSRRAFEAGFFWGAAIFTGFSFCGVIFGDRAELWEHGTFLVTLLACYMVAKAEFEERGRFV